MPPKKKQSDVYVNLSKSSKKLKKKSTSAEELEEYGFSLGRVLGQGSYCKVRSAVYEGEEVAVKVITRDKLSHEFATKFLPREIEVLSKINHENIVKVYKIFNFPKKVYIFMELIRDDLLGYVRSRGRLNEKEARKFFEQMVSAMKYLHGLNIAHRDLKCENIMIDDNFKIKIIDFGFCRSTVDSSGRRRLSETFCGSTAYAAPEVLQGLPYNPMMYDVWSLGCVLYIMTTGMMPYDDSHIRKMVQHQLKRQIKFPANYVMSHSLKDLIRHMLEPDVTKRLTMDRVARSAWLKDQDKDDETGEAASGRKSQSSKKLENLVSTGTQVNISSDDGNK
ncbi:testis-specific serine/threonine-protein kinase 1-like [Argiope bruennichi]|uniref:Testis-specific serine/threonine-protein like n=1 Tax=Argiope bruennichi TaxID=94029 RepID=A0A8T0FWR1_ARGBR|nr:testis-specific serine/threonine-protein kinase 1-like [Argiope bruennichi]KAF8794628.1 Testis-specific serine/threonine-protein like [Argiope bruennichi]